MYSNLISRASVIQLIQLSDSHLYADALARLCGVDTAESLALVVQQVVAERPQIDLLLATGDIAQEGELQAYQKFQRLTQGVGRVQRWLPGNHDQLEAMQRACVHTALLEQVVDLGNWRIILLYSQVSGAVAGRLAAPQLALLEEALRTAAERFVVVALHHHPLDMQAQWLEPIGLTNAPELQTLLGRFAKVRAVLWGHVHQEWDLLQGGIRWLACPSTAVQFMPRSAYFCLEMRPPGYRWLTLAADGTLDTGVARLAEGLVIPNLAAGGY